MTRTYAVTGGAGFLGAEIIDQLVRRGDRVRALTRASRLRTDHSAVTPVSGSLEDPQALAELVDGADAVLHCAGLTHALRDSEFQAVNADGAARVARAAREAGAYTVLVSSMAARKPELSAYAASKRAGEGAFAQAMSGGRWSALRAPAIYGPGDAATLPYFRLVKSGLAPEPAAEPPPRASILYVADVASAVIAAADQGLPAGVYEVRDDSPEGYAWREIGETLARTLGVKARRLRAPRFALDAYAGAASSAQRLFGVAPMVTPGKIAEFFHADFVARDNLFTAVSAWRPKTGLAEGFAKTVRWYKENGLL